ncbi:MAG: hypothetical protein N3A69_13880, partial [Leptospiraceae bacterium]|nr:hypothetical protein [Leptospiraceae bacterium]
LIIMGSDGKDDLVLSQDGEVRVINEDETLFLKSVEECQGNLDKIYNTNRERYEILADFSLLSIYFA